MRHDEHHDRVAGLGDDRPDRGVDRPVDPKQGVAQGRRDSRVVVGMAGVVQVPALVPGAVSFGEDLDEEIPTASGEQTPGSRPFSAAPAASRSTKDL